MRNIAEKGVSQAELDAIPGTGKEGRVTKKDMLAYLQNGRATAPAAPAPAAPTVATPAPAGAPKSAPAVSMNGEDGIVEMDRMRKLITDHMVRSVQTGPHVTSFVEADVTRIVDWRNRNKRSFKAQTGQKLTFTPFFIEAVAKALQEFQGSMPVWMATASFSRRAFTSEWRRPPLKET